MHNKMSLIRYYYSEMRHFHHLGGAFYRPLFFDYPNEAEAYSHQARNVMLGRSVKLGVLADYGSGSLNTEIVYPKGTWCRIFNRRGTDGCKTYNETTLVSLQSEPWEFALDLSEGSIIPMQDNKDIQAHTTAELQREAVELHVLPNCTDTTKDCTALGLYYNDDGETLVETEVNVYYLNYTQPQGKATTMTLNHQYKFAGKKINANDDLDGVSIYNAKAYGFDSAKYTVTATLEDNSTVVLSDAEYVPMTDRLTYNFGGVDGEK